MKGVIGTPPLDGLEVRLKVEDHVRVKFNLKKGRVDIRGADPEDLLAQLQQHCGLLAEPGQLVDVELEKPKDQKHEFRFDDDGELEIKAPSATLKVSAHDAAGNEGEVSVTPAFASPEPEDDDGDDDEGGQDDDDDDGSSDDDADEGSNSGSGDDDDDE